MAVTCIREGLVPPLSDSVRLRFGVASRSRFFSLVRTRKAHIRAYISATVTIALLVLVSFIVVEALEIPLLTDPSGWLDDAGIVGAVVSLGLLLVDVFVPIPSSVVMIANSAMIGFLVGRRSSRVTRRIEHRFARTARQSLQRLA